MFTLFLRVRVFFAKVPPKRIKVSLKALGKHVYQKKLEKRQSEARGGEDEGSSDTTDE